MVAWPSACWRHSCAADYTCSAYCRGRLDAVEAAAAKKLEAAEDVKLGHAAGGGFDSRAPVRMSGHIGATGVLQWSKVGGVRGS